MSQGAGAAGERGQTGAEGGIQAFDVRRVDLMRAATGRGQYLRHRLGCPGRLAHPPAKARDRALDTTLGHRRFTR